MGAGAILLCAAMAWFGVDIIRSDAGPVFLLVYWSVFLVLLLVALYIVMLDIRYIRLEYALGEREIFRSTFESEEFQQALRKAVDEERHRDATDRGN